MYVKNSQVISVLDEKVALQNNVVSLTQLACSTSESFITLTPVWRYTGTVYTRIPTDSWNKNKTSLFKHQRIIIRDKFEG